MSGQTVRLLKIFVASPSDVKLEREKAREEILGLRPLAHQHGYDLEPTGWETHATPGMGRSQELINRLVRECDLFIGILWRRFGLPTGEAASGTLEEFNLARERFTKERAPEIMLYFREVHPDFLADPGPQLQKVLDFKQGIEEGHLALYWQYRDPEHFAALLRQHITDWLLRLAPVTHLPDAPRVRTAGEIPPLAAFAEHLEYCKTELQKTARPLRLRTLNLPPLFLEEVDAERPRNMKVSNTVKLFPRLLILGEPGAGKTTSLKKLALEYAVWRGEGKEPGLNEPEDFNLPIFLDLSSYPTLSAGDARHGLWRLITASVRGVHDVDVRKRLAAGGCLLLLDGLNEVGEEYDEVVHQIRHLINEIPNNRFVVTCRPGVYREELRREFVTFQLERLSSFNASKVLEIEIGADKAQAAWKGLDEYTRDLCRNPLMLTLLADELRASDTPPQNRAQLFDRFVDRYLSEWARVKGAGSVRVEKEILSALAWRLGTKRTLLSADEAAAAMSARLAELQNRKEASAELNVATLNRDFLNHGLLRETAGQTGFFHQAVQEYFFAREVALHRSMEYILMHVSDPEWVEVLVFVCGLMEDATEVVREVMKNDPHVAARYVICSKQVNKLIVDDLLSILIAKYKDMDPARSLFYIAHREAISILRLEPFTTTPLLGILRQQNKDEVQAYLDLGVMYGEIDQWLRAAEFLKAGVKKFADNIDLRKALADALTKCKRYEDATQQYLRCLKDDPDRVDVHGNLGWCYYRHGRFSEAEKHISVAITTHPKPWLYLTLGSINRKKGRLDEAMIAYQQAIQICPNHSSAHEKIAITLREMGKYDDAIVEYEKAIELATIPKRIFRGVFAIAVACEKAGRTAQARQRYQEYLDRDPWGKHAPEAIAALERLGEQ